MLKLLFLPFSKAGSLIAARAGRRLSDGTWHLIDSDQPPRPDQRRASVPKLALALAIDGAIFRVVRGLADYGARRSFQRLTGRWPGEDPSAKPGTGSSAETGAKR